MRSTVRQRIILGAALGVLAMGQVAAAQAADAPKPRYGTWGVDYATMDRTVKPGDDFFAYAEGTWLKTAPIAPDSEIANRTEGKA